MEGKQRRKATEQEEEEDDDDDILIQPQIQLTALQDVEVEKYPDILCLWRR